MISLQDLLTFEWAWVMSVNLRSPTVIYRISPIHNDPYYLQFVNLEAVARCLLQSDKIDVVYITVRHWVHESIYVKFSLRAQDPFESKGWTTKWE